MKPLTDRQAMCLRIIIDNIAAHGIAPSHREIASAMGSAWTEGTRYHLRRLEAKGYIKVDRASPRAINVKFDEHGERHRGPRRRIVVRHWPPKRIWTTRGDVLGRVEHRSDP